APHYPATLVLAFTLEEQHAAFFELGEGRVPEVQAQDFAFAWQEVVFDVEPVHGFEMTAQHGDGYQVGEGGGFVAAGFDFVQRLQANLQILLVFGVPLRRSRVEIPAVVIEARPSSQLFDFGARLLFQMKKSHHHVSDLHTGVVDVVLNVDFPARKAQQTDKRVAENRVAQVAGVRGFVGVNAGMLDQNFPWGRDDFGFLVAREHGGDGSTLYASVDVAPQ